MKLHGGKGEGRDEGRARASVRNGSSKRCGKSNSDWATSRTGAKRRMPAKPYIQRTRLSVPITTTETRYTDHGSYGVIHHLHTNTNARVNEK